MIEKEVCTTKKMMELLGVSRQTLSQWRNGYTHSDGRKIPAKLIEEQHWRWVRGQVVYDKKAIEKLNGYK